MDKQSDKKLAELKERLDRGEYTVDPGAVADAILRRSRDMALLRAHVRDLRDENGTVEDGDQSRCSYPASGWAASRKRTPGSPLTARPIQVIRGIRGSLARAFSISFRASGGAQTQS